jgi:hypothetical protein
LHSGGIDESESEFMAVFVGQRPPSAHRSLSQGEEPENVTGMSESQNIKRSVGEALVGGSPHNLPITSYLEALANAAVYEDASIHK